MVSLSTAYWINPHTGSIKSIFIQQNIEFSQTKILETIYYLKKKKKKMSNCRPKCVEFIWCILSDSRSFTSLTYPNESYGAEMHNGLWKYKVRFKKPFIGLIWKYRYCINTLISPAHHNCLLSISVTNRNGLNVVSTVCNSFWYLIWCDYLYLCSIQFLDQIENASHSLGRNIFRNNWTYRAIKLLLEI